MIIIDYKNTQGEIRQEFIEESAWNLWKKSATRPGYVQTIIRAAEIVDDMEVELYSIDGGTNDGIVENNPRVFNPMSISNLLTTPETIPTSWTVPTSRLPGSQGIRFNNNVTPQPSAPITTTTSRARNTSPESPLNFQEPGHNAAQSISAASTSQDSHIIFLGHIKDDDILTVFYFKQQGQRVLRKSKLINGSVLKSWIDKGASDDKDIKTLGDIIGIGKGNEIFNSEFVKWVREKQKSNIVHLPKVVSSPATSSVTSNSQGGDALLQEFLTTQESINDDDILSVVFYKQQGQRKFRTSKLIKGSDLKSWIDKGASADEDIASLGDIVGIVNQNEIFSRQFVKRVTDKQKATESKTSMRSEEPNTPVKIYYHKNGELKCQSNVQKANWDRWDQGTKEFKDPYSYRSYYIPFNNVTKVTQIIDGREVEIYPINDKSTIEISYIHPSLQKRKRRYIKGSNVRAWIVNGLSASDKIGNFENIVKLQDTIAKRTINLNLIKEQAKQAEINRLSTTGEPVAEATTSSAEQSLSPTGSAPSFAQDQVAIQDPSLVVITTTAPNTNSAPLTEFTGLTQETVALTEKSLNEPSNTSPDYSPMQPLSPRVQTPPQQIPTISAEKNPPKIKFRKEGEITVYYRNDEDIEDKGFLSKPDWGRLKKQSDCMKKVIRATTKVEGYEVDLYPLPYTHLVQIAYKINGHTFIRVIEEIILREWIDEWQRTGSIETPNGIIKDYKDIETIGISKRIRNIKKYTLMKKEQIESLFQGSKKNVSSEQLVVKQPSAKYVENIKVYFKNHLNANSIFKIDESTWSVWRLSKIRPDFIIEIYKAVKIIDGQEVQFYPSVMESPVLNPSEIESLANCINLKAVRRLLAVEDQHITEPIAESTFSIPFISEPSPHTDLVFQSLFEEEESRRLYLTGGANQNVIDPEEQQVDEYKDNTIHTVEISEEAEEKQQLPLEQQNLSSVVDSASNNQTPSLSSTSSVSNINEISTFIPNIADQINLEAVTQSLTFYLEKQRNNNQLPVDEINLREEETFSFSQISSPQPNSQLPENNLNVTSRSGSGANASRSNLIEHSIFNSGALPTSASQTSRKRKQPNPKEKGKQKNKENPTKKQKKH